MIPTPLWKSKKFERVEPLVFSEAWKNRPRTASTPIREFDRAPEGISAVKRANKNFGKVPGYISDIKLQLAEKK
ncbi:MAG: hypothetical protein V2I33_22995 [Kangiellaceae bacterium]|jgi:hypothetical protein|nr:hypothetical protein [Kangiellaceae bacterium]